MATPLVPAMIICDSFYTEPITGKISVLGMFGSVPAIKIPLTLSQISVFCALTEAQGWMTATVRIVDVDEFEPPLAEQQAVIDFADPLAVVEFGLSFADITYSDTGDYRVQLFAAENFLSSVESYCSVQTTRSNEWSRRYF